MTAQKLKKAGISNDKIAAVTGHQNEQSLQDYAVGDMEDHQYISAVLSATKVLQHPFHNQAHSHLEPLQYY